MEALSYPQSNKPAMWSSHRGIFECFEVLAFYMPDKNNDTYGYSISESCSGVTNPPGLHFIKYYTLEICY